jgi:outer membrane lipoprotein-sorting protein
MVIGTETIDGKVCTVVQCSVDGQTMKMWLWKDHEIPIRVEVTTDQGLTVMEYKNIQFVDIPDSMFTLPERVQNTNARRVKEAKKRLSSRLVPPGEP